jgi:hypothetical protein
MPVNFEELANNIAKIASALENLGHYYKTQDLLIKQMTNMQREFQQNQLKLEARFDKFIADVSSDLKTLKSPRPTMSAPNPEEQNERIIIPRPKATEPKSESKEQKPKPDVKEPEQTFEAKMIAVVKEAEETFPDFDKQEEVITYPVTQSVRNERNKAMYMATVQIYKDGVLVDTRKANTSGTWQALLAPGKYTIKIRKKENGFTYEGDQTITIDNASLTLPMYAMRPTSA